MSQGMLGVSVHDARGVVSDLLEKLGGPNGEEWLTALKRFLRKENPWDGKSAPTSLVWRTITLGTFKDVKSLKKALKQRGFRTDFWADDYMLDRPVFSLASEEIELDLVRRTVAELGFEEGAELREIYASARERGLNICPAEVGPTLRYQYPDQPRGESLIVAMEPIAFSDNRGGLFVGDDREGLFDVKRGLSGRRRLDARLGSLSGRWRADCWFVFVNPRTMA